MSISPIPIQLNKAVYVPNRKHLVVGIVHSTLCSYNFTANKMLPVGDPSLNVMRYGVSPTGDFVVTIDRDCDSATVPIYTMHLRDWRSTESISTVRIQKYPHSMSVSPDGNHIAICRKKGVDIWDRRSLGSGPVHTLKIRGFGGMNCYSPDGKYFAHGIHLCSATSYQPIYDIRPRGANCEAFSSDSKYLAVYDMGKVLLIGIDKGNIVREYSLSEFNYPLCTAFSPDGRKIAIGHYDGFTVHEIASNKIIQNGNAGKTVLNLSYSDETLLVSTHRDSYIWDPRILSSF